MKLIPVDGDPFAEEQQAKPKLVPVEGNPFEGPKFAPQNVYVGGAAIPFDVVKNIPTSAMHFAGNLAKAAMHPLDTAMGLGDTLAGGLRNLTPEFLRNVIDKADPNTQNAERASETASVVGQFYKDRYGSLEGVKNTLTTDPVGAAADLSMGAGGFAKLASSASRIPALASKVNMPRVAEALSGVSDATNPVNAMVGMAKTGANAVGGGISNVVGFTTGTGPSSVRGAAKSGYDVSANNAKPEFMANLTGKAEMTDVLDQARQAVQTIRQNASNSYKQGMAATAADTTRLPFEPIDRAYANVVASMKHGDRWKIDKAEIGTIKEIGNVLDEWKQDPSAQTAIGLDALKQRLDATYPESPMHSQAQRAITAVRNAVKDTIVEQSPEYAQTMRDYEIAIKLQKELEKSLSLGHKSSADTALRKLQSISRNNANANYGYRLELAKKLQQEGGVDLRPAISGQALSSWLPRGLAGQGAGWATLGAASLMNPNMLYMLPLESPRLMGLTAYGAGRGAGLLAKGAKSTGITPEQARWASLLASRQEDARY